MFDRFTENAKKAMNLARRDAAPDGGCIEPRHILRAILEVGGIASAVLQRLGVSPAALCTPLESGTSPSRPPSDRLPFSDTAKTVLEGSMKAAADWKHNYIGTEHLLFALAVNAEGAMRRAFDDAGLSTAKLDEAILSYRDEPATGESPLQSTKTTGMFDRFTELAKKAMFQARERALVDSGCIEPRHILPSIFEVGGSASAVLQRLGVLPAVLCASLKAPASPPRHHSGPLPFSDATKTVLEGSLTAAAGWKHNYIGTEHLLFSLAMNAVGAMKRAFDDAGLSKAKLEEAILAYLGEPAPAKSPPKSPACGFCSKPRKGVRSLIAGPPGIYICDDCIVICESILTERGDEPEPGHATDRRQCTFCELPGHRVKQLIAGPPGLHICNECVGICRAILVEEDRKREAAQPRAPEPRPSTATEIVRAAAPSLPHHQEALARIAYAAERHLAASGKGGSEPGANGVLLVGPTGSGKAELVQAIARGLARAWCRYPASALLHGEDASNVMLELLGSAGFNSDNAEEGLCVVEGLESIGAGLRDGPDPALAAQRALASLLGGARQRLSVAGKKQPGMRLVLFDPSKVFFVGVVTSDDFPDEAHEQLGGDIESRRRALASQGMSAQLLAHFGHIVALRSPGAADLRQALEGPFGILQTYVETATAKKLQLSFSEEAVDAIVQRALASHNGLRALRPILDDALFVFLSGSGDSQTTSLRVEPHHVGGGTPG